LRDHRVNCHLAWLGVDPAKAIRGNVSPKRGPGGAGGSGCLGKPGLHFLLIDKQFWHARPLLHPLEMHHAILEWGKIEVELRSASKTPEEVGIDSGEVFEEPFATRELIVRDLIVLE
jgi:hypothetical protein